MRNVFLSFAALASSYAADAPPFSERFTFHSPPSPLPAGATTEDYPRFLGPHDSPVSYETKLRTDLPEFPLWELARGDAYTAPAISGEYLVTFHRFGDSEVTDCLHPVTGKHHWTTSQPVTYSDRYGYSSGPRASPVIDGDRVYTYGVTGNLTCRTLASGEELWQRDLAADYKMRPAFFGLGASPLIAGDLLIQNVSGDATVIALDKLTGEQKWTFSNEWGASYASPLKATFHGKEIALVFAGGESRPPTGGLLVLELATGKLLSEFPWRADKYESVNASTPLVLPGNRVFLTETYEGGGILLEFDETFTPKMLWQNRDAKFHWTTPVLQGDYLYGFAGRNEPDAALICFGAADGKTRWKKRLLWDSPPHGKNSFFRGNLLSVDGRFLALGESGTLAWLDLTPEKPEIASRTDLFYSRQTWTPPAISKGLLYVAQNNPDRSGGTSARLLCYDLRRPPAK